MPVLLLGGGILLILMALWAGDIGGIRTGAEQAVNGTPVLQADREIIDLGDVKLGETVSASFTLTNTGDGALKFEEAPYVEIVEGC